MARIAFIGLGKMGTGMASRLLAAGHQVCLYNRTAAKADSLLRRGAQPASSPKEACLGVTAVTSLASDRA
jgi:3-hydroxyisobutyrate dehydrogenase